VTGSPASAFSFPPNSDSDSEPSSLQSSIIYPATPPLDSADYLSYSQHGSTPRPIPDKATSYRDLATPPLTPDDGIDDHGSAEGDFNTKQSNDALDFLQTLFPRDGFKALPFSRSVSISGPDMGAAFDGVVLELPDTPKTLYVDGKSAESVGLRERYAQSALVHFLFFGSSINSLSIVALLDLADERLQCSAFVIVLERSSPSLGDVLHSLMYVGGTVVTKPPFQVDPAYVLVGMEI